MNNPYNVQTFAVRSIRRKGKRRVILTGENGEGETEKRILKIPDERMRDVQKYIAEFDHTLLVDFDVPSPLEQYPRQVAAHFLAALEERILRNGVRGDE